MKHTIKRALMGLILGLAGTLALPVMATTNTNLTATVIFPLRTMAGMAGARSITLTPAYNPLGSVELTNIFWGAPILAYPTNPAAGFATVHLAANRYTVTMSGAPGSFTLTVAEADLGTTNYATVMSTNLLTVGSVAGALGAYATIDYVDAAVAGGGGGTATNAAFATNALAAATATNAPDGNPLLSTGSGLGKTNDGFAFNNSVRMIPSTFTYESADTNWLWFTGAGTEAANIGFHWETDHWVGTNSAFTIISADGYWYMLDGDSNPHYRNVNGDLHISFYWEQSDSGTNPAPTARFGTNIVTSANILATNNTGPVAVFLGMTAPGGGFLNFGTDCSMLYGIDFVDGVPHANYPSTILSSLDCHDDGYFNTILSSWRVNTHGQRVTAVASGSTEVWCQNADSFVAACEFGSISNNHGVSATLASSGTNWADRSAVVLNTSGFIGPDCQFLTVPYADDLRLTNVSYSLIGGRSLTASKVSSSVVQANSTTLSNLNSCMVIGKGLSVSDKTNHVEFGVAGGTMQLVGTVSGNLSGATNLPAGELRSGTVPLARLPTEVALLNRTNDFAAMLSNAAVVTGTFTSTVCGYIRFTNAGVAYSLVVSTNLP